MLAIKLPHRWLAVVIPPFLSSGYGGSLRFFPGPPLQRPGKEPSPSSAALSLSWLSDQVECLNITLKTTLALWLATLPLSTILLEFKLPPPDTEWSHWSGTKLLNIMTKVKSDKKKINGSPSLWLLPIGFSIPMTSDKEGQRSWDHFWEKDSFSFTK